jgi:hypothetical protein
MIGRLSGAVTLCVLLLVAVPCWGATWYVDVEASGAADGTSWTDAFQTIQEAVDAAVGGDEIWVREGEYAPIQFTETKSLALYAGFPQRITNPNPDMENRNPSLYETTIDGEHVVDSSVQMRVPMGSTPPEYSVSLDGFTITGGGLIDDSGATDQPDVVKPGGGICILGIPEMTVSISNCQITSNVADTGGGIYAQDCHLQVVNSVISNNTADGGGGGVCTQFCPFVAITGCDVIGNHDQSLESAGGGFFDVVSTAVSVEDSSFVGNTSGGTGGGAIGFLQTLTSFIRNCVFASNSVTGDGGAVYLYWCPPYMPQFVNCTFTQNSAVGNGGALAAYLSTPVLINSILWSDSSGIADAEIFNYDDPSTSEIESYTYVRYSDVQGGYGGMEDDNIDTDPLLIDGYHLRADSPCWNAGANEVTDILTALMADYLGSHPETPVATLPETDFEGDDRVIEGTVDMGADECLQTVLDSDGDGISDADESLYGTNPHDPDTDDDGLNDGDEIVWGTDPLSADTDEDGLKDGKEVTECGTDPTLADTDGDGYSDGDEVKSKSDPLDPASVPRPPKGRYSLMVRCFIDLECDRWFNRRADRRLEGIPVTVTFANGTQVTKYTRRNGMVLFHGFGARGGVVVSVDWPDEWNGYTLVPCDNSRTVYELKKRHFRWYKFKFLQFRATVQDCDAWQEGKRGRQKQRLKHVKGPRCFQH